MLSGDVGAEHSLNKDEVGFVSKRIIASPRSKPGEAPGQSHPPLRAKALFPSREGTCINCSPSEKCRRGSSPPLEVRQNWIAELLDPDENRVHVDLVPPDTMKQTKPAINPPYLELEDFL
jgi:hypothetical protein